MRVAWLVSIGAFLFLVFGLPLFIVLHAASGALFGLTILCLFAAIQYPVFLLIRRWLPPIHDDEQSARHP